MLFSTLSGSTPWLIVRLPCGSMSTASTRWPDSLKATARLSAVVVLATPPFWLANAITLAGPVLFGAASFLGLDPAAVFVAADLVLADLPLPSLLASLLARFGPTASSARRRPISGAFDARLLRRKTPISGLFRRRGLISCPVLEESSRAC